MSNIAVFTESVNELLQDAAARNVLLHLHYEDLSGLLVVAKTRIRELNAKRILADAISYVDTNERISLNLSITAHFSMRRNRLQFETVLEDDHVPLPARSGKRSFGVALRRPQSVTESQRRTYVRISLAAGDAIPVQVTRAHAETPDTCAIDAPHCTGRILNLSAGGMAVLFNCKEMDGIRENDRFYLAFRLPNTTEDFNMLGALRHTRRVDHNNSLRASYAFKLWGGAKLRSDQHRIQRFVVEREREHLRRRK